jgi:hypothetical protein
MQPSPITGPSNNLLEKLWDAVQKILNDINDVKNHLGDQIGEFLKPLLKDIVGAGARITQTLADNLAQLLPLALKLAADAANRAAEVAAAFVAQAASVGDLMDGAADKLRLEKDGLWKFITDALGAGFGGGIAALLSDIEDQHVRYLNPLLDAIQETDTVPPWVKDALGLRAGVTNPLALIVGISLLMSVAGQFALAILGPEVAITAQKNFERAPNLIITPMNAAQLVAQQLRDYGPMEEIAKRNGFNADQFRMLADLAFQFPAAETITGARLRGAITTEAEDRLLNRRGYNAESRELVKAMALQLPGVQDTIRMAVREVFDPVQRPALTLDADYPSALTDHARAIGLSEEWARNFWAAHWELPGLNAVFDMLHRGLITRDQVAAFLKAADYAPVWRDKLIELSFDVFTRVDIRRVHDLLKKDHAWLLEQHKRLGYNEADSETLSQFVELLNDDERAARRKELTGPLVGRIISNVVNGTLNDEQATTFFVKLGYRQDAIDSFLVEARLIRNEQRTERVGNLLGDLYIKDRRTKLEATTQLRERGFTDSEIEERFRGWELEKELRAPSEKEEKERDLTRADIEAMYRARQLTHDDASAVLMKLRYSADEVKSILDLADFREKVAEDKDRVEVVHRKFVKGTMTKTSAEQELGKIGLRATQIAASLARWELEVSAKTADLSVGQVGEIYQLGQWDDAKTRTYLLRIGYDDDEASALLRLWGSKAEAQKRRDEIARVKAEEAKKREAQRVIETARRADKALAVGQLLAAGMAAVLDWSTVRAEIVSKGYSVTEADTLIRTKQAQGVKKNA